MKAMILAAGRGLRMQPLTDHTPKPLLNLRGEPLIVHMIKNLAANGFADIVINISHLADQFIAVLGNGEQFNVNIQYSHEPEALETGGGIIKALPLLGTKPFLVVSADIWTRYPFIQLHNQSNTELAHLVLVPNPSFHLEGDFALYENKISAKHSPKYTYGNIGVFHPNIFKNLLPNYLPLFQLLRPLINDKQISGEIYQGEWDNIGTADQLKKLNEHIN